MMQVMKDIGGVEIPESLAKLAGEGDIKDRRTMGMCRR